MYFSHLEKENGTLKKKAVSGVMLTLLLLGMLTLTFNVSYRSVLAVEQRSIGPGTLPDWHEDAQVQLGWIFDDPTNPQDSDPLPGWNISVGDIPVWDYDPNRTVWDQPGQWYIRIPNLDIDKPVKNFWISWVYDFDTYLPGLRSATNFEWFPYYGFEDFQYIEEWFDGDGNLTTDHLEAVYARVTLSVNLYPNPQYEDIWLGTYGEIALAREVYIMTLCTELPPPISIYTNKYSYSAGDTMCLGLHVVNPLDRPITVCVAVWLEKPVGPPTVILHAHAVTLPASFTYSNPTFKSFVLPSMPAGIYKWHAALLKPTTHAILAEDPAEWEFS
jgi:hypothetical protein